ncbi:hypothetical protein C8Q80DRAFT_1215132, partial [Daedaleopsis nitida]
MAAPLGRTPSPKRGMSNGESRPGMITLNANTTDTYAAHPTTCRRHTTLPPRAISRPHLS